MGLLKRIKRAAMRFVLQDAGRGKGPDSDEAYNGEGVPLPPGGMRVVPLREHDTSKTQVLWVLHDGEWHVMLKPEKQGYYTVNEVDVGLARRAIYELYGDDADARLAFFCGGEPPVEDTEDMLRVSKTVTLRKKSEGPHGEVEG